LYKKIVNSVYLINIIIQSFVSLLFPIAVAILVAWYLAEQRSVGKWIYVVLILFGVFIGLFSMVKFVLSAMSAFENLEREQAEKAKNQKKSQKEETKKTDE